MRSDDIRQYVHAGSGAGAFLLYYLPWYAVTAVLAAGALLAALAGHFTRGGGRSGTKGGGTALHRPGETLLRSGATTYALGMIAAVLLFPPEAAFVGWITLAVGDSASTLVGTRYPLFVLAPNRSLGGTLAFVGATVICLCLGLLWWHGAVDLEIVGAVALVGLFSAAAEVVAQKFDDNLIVPLVAATTYTLAG